MKNNKRLLSILVRFGYVFIVGSILYSNFSHQVYDDPFITYRYAENLKNGFGFVYNPGERILSTTTPLFAMLLAALGDFWTDFQSLANLIGAFSIAIGGVFLWELGKTWKTPFVGWGGLLLYPTFPLLLSTFGSETPFFLALCLGAFVLYARNHFGLTAIILSLAILTRSDGVLVAALLVFHYLWANRTEIRNLNFWRRQSWGSLGIALGLLLIWHSFAWYYFGSPLPVTLAAKQAQGRMAISQLFAPGILQVAGWYSSGWNYWIEFGLFGIGVVFALLKRRYWLLVLSWTGLYFLAYSLLGVTNYFWYYAPLVPGWVVGIGLGLSFLTG